jgi:hypothetical protein
MKPQDLVEKLLSEDAHEQLWDRAVEVAEQAGEDSLAMDFVNLLAQVYNGGFEQYVYNGYAESYAGAIQFLRTLKSPAARVLYSRLRALSPLISQAKEANDSARTDGGEENPMEQFENDFGIAEDFVYNHANVDPILAEMTGGGDAVPTDPRLSHDD